MDPVPTYPLPPEPPIDLGDLIRRTNGAAHAMMPLVEGFYKAIDQRTSDAEALMRRAAQPLVKSLNVRTSSATRKLATATQPVADMLAERTAAAQRGMLDFPIPTPTPTSVYWAALHCPDLTGRVIPAERGSPPDPGDGWRTFGPYATEPQAAAALTTYRVYLRADPTCYGAPAGNGAGPTGALDFYWVD